MLNGKFYTGLPPKMIDRQNSAGCNRQESHFFWPDDTQLESAADTRVRRRTSLQLDNASRPRIEQRHSILPEVNEVDTRQRFHKEFAKSSIQFYDNLQDEVQPARKSKQQITPKLTATKWELPADSGIDEAYTLAKRKQAYDSKIEFNDFMDENQYRRNSVDRNDKRDVERNTKNSPKLQVKRNVKSLSIERELSEQPQAKPLNRIARDFEREEVEDTLPYKQRPFEPQYSPHPIRAQRLNKAPPPQPLPQSLPKKILKHTSSAAASSYDDDYGHDGAMDYVDNGMRNMHMRSPKKHVTYSDVTYESPPPPRDHYAHDHHERPTIPRHLRNYTVVEDGDDDALAVAAAAAANAIEQRRVVPNMRAGSANIRQQRATTPSDQYMETGTHTLNNANSVNHNKRHSNYNNNNNYNNNRAVYNNQQQQQLETRKILPKRSLAAATTTTTDTAESYNTNKSSSFASASAARASSPESESHEPQTDSRQHLRSSLCFNGEALVFAPTTSTTPTTRRNARSSATQRVSVGLPD